MTLRGTSRILAGFAAPTASTDLAHGEVLKQKIYFGPLVCKLHMSSSPVPAPHEVELEGIQQVKRPLKSLVYPYDKLEERRYKLHGYEGIGIKVLYCTVSSDSICTYCLENTYYLHASCPRFRCSILHVFDRPHVHSFS